MSPVNSQSTTSRLVEHASAKIASAPIFTESAHRAYRLIESPTCSIKSLTHVIQCDPPLTASILALANSALYAPPKPIDRLRDAVVLLGLRECQHLILAACTTKFVNRLHFDDEETRRALVFHSCATAMACRELGRRGQWCFEGEEYCAGLLHDIGRFILASLEPKQFAEARLLDPDEHGNLVEAERDIFGIDHCQLGKQFCTTNQLPMTLVESAAFHHSIEQATEAAPLVRVVAYAEELAKHLSSGRPHDEYEPCHPGLVAAFNNGAQRELGFELTNVPELLTSIMSDTVSALSVFSPPTAT